jgi:hypothetical protein
MASAEQTAAARSELIDMLNRAIAGDGAPDLDKTLITLSGGALVFSMTFIGTLAPAHLWLPILVLAWFAFAICIILIIISQRKAQNAQTRRAVQLSEVIETLHGSDVPAGLVARATINVTVNRTRYRLNNYSVAAFLIGTALLGFFVTANLLATPPATNSQIKHAPLTAQPRKVPVRTDEPPRASVEGAFKVGATPIVIAKRSLV